MTRRLCVLAFKPTDSFLLTSNPVPSCFVCSPVKYDKKVLETIGKKLRKNGVSLDIVDFGEVDDGKPEKLEALFAAVNNNDSSHLVHIPPGPNPLCDVLIRCNFLFYTVLRSE